MLEQRPLTTLLSQALVAFTIEFDNTWESRIVQNDSVKLFHVSQVMWSNFLRFVGKGGISVSHLSLLAGYPEKKVHPCLAGMIRWGYVKVDEPSNRSKKVKPLEQRIRLTPSGSRAAEVWMPLAKEIEARWMERHGSKVQSLRKSLTSLLCQTSLCFPHYYMVLNSSNGMRTPTPHQPHCDESEGLSLSGLLSQSLQLLSLDYEQHSEMSLAHGANLVRVLNSEGVPVKELPLCSGISKQAIAMITKFLQKKGLVETLPIPNTARGQMVRLTDLGLIAQQDYLTSHIQAEKRWSKRFSSTVIEQLRQVLETIVLPSEQGISPLLQGLIPPSQVWRAKWPPIKDLPHHVMVLHRGGYPDGS